MNRFEKRILLGGILFAVGMVLRYLIGVSEWVDLAVF